MSSHLGPADNLTLPQACHHVHLWARDRSTPAACSSVLAAQVLGTELMCKMPQALAIWEHIVAWAQRQACGPLEREAAAHFAAGARVKLGRAIALHLTALPECHTSLPQIIIDLQCIMRYYEILTHLTEPQIGPGTGLSLGAAAETDFQVDGVGAVASRF